jgi:acylphosphatase
MINKSEICDVSSFIAVAHGQVQGVYFRAFILDKASQLGLKGTVRNLPTGVDLEVQAEGKKENLEKLLNYLKQGPKMAIIDNLTVEWTNPCHRYIDFRIIY